MINHPLNGQFHLMAAWNQHLSRIAAQQRYHQQQQQTESNPPLPTTDTQTESNRVPSIADEDEPLDLSVKQEPSSVTDEVVAGAPSTSRSSSTIGDVAPDGDARSSRSEDPSIWNATDLIGKHT